MAKRRKIDLSCNFIEGEGSTGPKKTPSPVEFLIDRRIKSQKHQLSHGITRSRFHSNSVTDASGLIVHGADGPNILRLQLHDLLERAKCTTQPGMSKAQDAVQELRQIIEQIPPRDGMNVRIRFISFIAR